MEKIKIEKIREWFTPIQACYYLFEDAEKIANDELIAELTNLVNGYRLNLHIKNYHFKPFDEHSNDANHLALIAYYNEHNYIEVPALYLLLDDTVLNEKIVEGVAIKSLIPDIFNFSEQYKTNKEFLDAPFCLDTRPPSKCNIHFGVLVNSFEPCFPKEILNQFIQEQNNRKVEKKDFFSSKEHVSMLKIVHALASNGYKYPRHGAMKEMVEDFQRNDNGVSETTLKKYLDEFGKL